MSHRPGHYARASKPRRRNPPPSAPARQVGRPDRGPRWTFVALGIIALVSLLRLLHLGFPLERDEGEFGYIAQELLRGVPMYVSAYTQKLPGTYLFYALFISVFGQSIAAIHLGLLLTNAATMWLIFLTLRKTHSGPSGCLGALVFGVMASSPTVFGFATHATFFVSLFAVAGLYALLLARERGQVALFLASGLCFGSAFLMKQSGLFFAALGPVLLVADYLAARPRRPGRFALHLLVFGAGALAPALLTAAYYLAIGKLSLLWFWAFKFAGEFTEQVGAADALRNARLYTRAVMAGFELLWALAAAGLVVTLRDRALGRNRYVYATFAAAGVLSVVPGFYFTNHYYIALLPALALLAGALVPGVSREGPLQSRGLLAATGVWALTGLGLAIAIASHAEYYFGQVSDTAESRQIYAGNVFPESIEIGDYLRRHTSPEERIAILGSETQILFYAQRRSASRFVNTYFLTADQPRNREMQQEMIRDIERARPRYLLLVGLPTSWWFRPDSPTDILDWFDRYRRGGYALEGVLILTERGGVLKWGAEARAQDLSRTPYYLGIFRRLDPGAIGP